MDNTDVIHWFAMRATYRRELLAKEQLEQNGLEQFIPMQYRFMVVDGKKKRVLVPAVHNLIFVHSTKQQIQEFKKTRSYIQYMTKVSGGARVPLTIPDRQMEAFIRIASTNDEHIIYLGAGHETLAAGTKVRVIEGIFAGTEGVLTKVAGIRDKRVVVSLDGLISIAAAHIPSEYLEVIK